MEESARVRGTYGVCGLKTVAHISQAPLGAARVGYFAGVEEKPVIL